MKLKEWMNKKFARNLTVVGSAVLVIMLTTYFGFGITNQEGIVASTIFDEKDGLIGQGTIETKEVNINTKIPGRVVKLYVEEGQEVKAGDPLVEISSEELQAKKTQATAAVAQAEAALKAAKQQLEQAEAGLAASNGLVEQAQAGVTAANEKVNEASAGVKASQKQYEAALAIKEKADNGARTQEVAQAQAAYDLMVTSYDRVKQLAEKGAVSQQKLDEVKTQMEVSKETLEMAKEGARTEDKKAATATSEQAAAGLEASQTRVNQAEAGLTAAQAQLTQAMAGVESSNALVYQAKAGVEAKEGLVRQAKGVLEEVEAYLKDVVVTAPIDGTVTSINTEEGELVSTGTQMAIVSNLKGAWVEVNMEENQIGKLMEGQKVAVNVPAFEDKIFEGVIATINDQPNFAVKRATNENGDFDIVSFAVKIKLDNSEETLRPGMSAYVQFKSQEDMQ